MYEHRVTNHHPFTIVLHPQQNKYSDPKRLPCLASYMIRPSGNECTQTIFDRSDQLYIRKSTDQNVTIRLDIYYQYLVNHIH